MKNVFYFFVTEKKNRKTIHLKKSLTSWKSKLRLSFRSSQKWWYAISTFFVSLKEIHTLAITRGLSMREKKESFILFFCWYCGWKEKRCNLKTKLLIRGLLSFILLLFYSFLLILSFLCFQKKKKKKKKTYLTLKIYFKRN